MPNINKEDFLKLQDDVNKLLVSAESKISAVNQEIDKLFKAPKTSLEFKIAQNGWGLMQIALTEFKDNLHIELKKEIDYIVNYYTVLEGLKKAPSTPVIDKEITRVENAIKFNYDHRYADLSNKQSKNETSFLELQKLTNANLEYFTNLLFSEPEKQFSSKVLPLGNGLLALKNTLSNKNKPPAATWDGKKNKTNGLLISESGNSADKVNIDEVVAFENGIFNPENITIKFEIRHSWFFQNKKTERYFFILGWGSAIVLRRDNNNKYYPYKLYSSETLEPNIYISGDKNIKELKKIPNRKLNVQQRTVIKTDDWLKDNKLNDATGGQPYYRTIFEEPEKLHLDKVVTYGVSSCNLTIVSPKTTTQEHPSFIILAHTNNRTPIPIRSILKDIWPDTSEPDSSVLVPISKDKKDLNIFASIFPDIVETYKFESKNLFPPKLDFKGEVIIMTRENFIWAINKQDGNSQSMVTYVGHDSIGLDLSDNRVDVIANYGSVIDNPKPADNFATKLSSLKLIANGKYNLKALESIQQKYAKDNLSETEKNSLYNEMMTELKSRVTKGWFGRKSQLIDLLEDRSKVLHKKKWANITETQQFKIFETLLIDLMNFNLKRAEFLAKYNPALTSNYLKYRCSYTHPLNYFSTLYEVGSKISKDHIIDHSPSTDTKSNLASKFNMIITEKQKKRASWWPF